MSPKKSIYPSRSGIARNAKEARRVREAREGVVDGVDDTTALEQRILELETYRKTLEINRRAITNLKSGRARMNMADRDLVEESNELYIVISKMKDELKRRK